MKTTIMNLPPVVARYLEAANRFDAPAAAACFTPDARVLDERQDHIGAAAIERWVSETSREYRPQTRVTHAQATGDGLTMRVAVTGDFPGSSLELDYTIRLRGGQITELSIR